MATKYEAVHQSLSGPGDARPTALQIIKDENIEGKWSDKTILITGCSSGIGIETAKALHETGAIVYATARDLNKAKTALSSLVSSPRFHLLELDLNSTASVRQCAETFLRQSDRLNILINNAALIINRPFEDFSVAEYEDQVRVNSSAGFVLSQAVAPAMKAARYGKIINFCSLTLNGRWDGYVPYVASKGALLGLTRTLARELGPHGIRVNAVSPGAVVSDAEARVFGDRAKEYNDWIIENQSLKSRIEPENIADLVVFLASPDSDMISGQEIRIDGGW